MNFIAPEVINHNFTEMSSGIGDWGLRIEVQVSEFGKKDFGYRTWDLGTKNQRLWSPACGLGSRVQSSGFRVEGLW